MKSILITGGAGFIGSHVTRLFVKKYPEYKIYNLDKLTYAGNLENILDIESFKNYRFIKCDIGDQKIKKIEVFLESLNLEEIKEKEMLNKKLKNFF